LLSLNDFEALHERIRQGLLYDPGIKDASKLAGEPYSHPGTALITLSAKIFLSHTSSTQNSKNLKPSRFLTTKLKKIYKRKM
jgi:hypothetical protein